MSEVFCGNLKLIYSNRICCANDDAISFSIPVMGDDKISVAFKFINDGGEYQTKASSPENGSVVFELHNYVNPLGTGLKKPVELGTVNDKKVFIVFFAYKLGEALPILDISLYLEV